MCACPTATAWIISSEAALFGILRHRSRNPAQGLKADTLLLCGGLTDVCVHYTFVDAHQHDYYARVIEDCVGGSSFEAHEASLRAMEYLQRDARCASEEVVAAFDARGRQAA